MKTPLLALALGLVCQAGTAQSVLNVQASQRPETRLVDITYDLVASTSAYVTVAVSTNAGSAYDIIATTLHSDSGTPTFGANVSPGLNRHIIWDAGVDWSNRFSSLVRVSVTAVLVGSAPTGMVLIPAGNNSGTDPDFGAYSLTVNAFNMDKYLVTKAQWDEVYNWAITHGYTFANAGSGKAANHPVQSVSWHDCVKWCNARSEKEGRQVSYRVGGNVYRGVDDNAVTCATNVAGYRLPTDVEFHYAARGGLSGKRFPWGDTIDHTKANYYGSPASSGGPAYDTGYGGYDTRFSTTGYPYTSPVDTFAANGYGLYDMAGNLWEWCWDWYPGYEGSYRVNRGGGWLLGVYYCRVGFRDLNPPYDVSYRFGFRAVLPPGQ